MNERSTWQCGCALAALVGVIACAAGPARAQAAARPPASPAQDASAPAVPASGAPDGTRPAPADAAQPGAAGEARILVREVRVEGNTLLPEAELARIVAPLAGTQASVFGLRRMASAVQQAYRRAGWGGVVAYLPEQDLSGGEVVVRVVEGRLARVQVGGNRHYDAANVRRSVPGLREGATPRVRAIDRDIQLANENPAKELRVTLTAGARPGDVDALVDVAERNPLRVFAGLDNTGTPGTGGWRASLGVQHANLWQRDHVGTVQVQTSPSEPDRVRIWSVGYRVPLYGHAASIDAFYARSTVSTGATATTAGTLQFTGRGDVAGVRFNRYLPRLGEYDQRLVLGLDRRAYDNDCSVGNLGPAGCGPAAASVTVVPLSLAYVGQVQTPLLAWGASASLAGNVGGSSGDAFRAARPGAPRHYLVARASAHASRTLARGFGVGARVSAQYTDDALVPGEQFGLGGASSVRGYRERETAGDRGVAASLEAFGSDVRRPVGGADLSLRPLAFVDLGRVWNRLGAPCSRTADSTCTLAGAGVGVRFGHGRHLSGRLDLARALKDGGTGRSGDTRAHVALNVVF